MPPMRIGLMNPIILGLAVEITIQAVFLTVALWIMIKLQNLDYNLPGLIGTAFLACGLDSILTYILEHWFQSFAGYFSAPVYIVVLFVCVSKVTQAEAVDVIFTVMVGGALRFGMNLWLIGALMGDLRPSAREAGNEPFGNVEGGYPTAVETNRPAALNHTTNKTSGKIAHAEKPPAKNEPPNPPKPLPTAKPQGGPASIPTTPAQSFSLKGIISSGKPSAMIYSGVKTYTIFAGDSLVMETPSGKVTVRCEQLDKDKVVLNVGGEPVTLSVP